MNFYLTTVLFAVVLTFSNSLPLDTSILSDSVDENDKARNTEDELNTTSKEETINLNLNRVNKNDRMDQQRPINFVNQNDIDDIFDTNRYSEENPTMNAQTYKPLNAFNSNDVKRLKEQPSASTLDTAKISMLRDRDREFSRHLSPMDKIFDYISRSTFKVKGLIIINNNNNNNNIDEDKFTIDEIIKLLEKRDYIGYNDIMAYDQTRKLSAIKKQKEASVRTLKMSSPSNINSTDPDLRALNTTELVMETVAQFNDPNTIINSNHDPIVTINMLKAKKGESVKPLQLDSLRFDTNNKAGVIIINNKNNNNNEKVAKAYGYGYENAQPVNIVNNNDGVQLPIEKLSDKDRANLVENAVIVNNDNNNNNIL